MTQPKTTSFSLPCICTRKTGEPITALCRRGNITALFTRGNMLSRRRTGLSGRSSCRTGRPLLPLFLAALLAALSPASAFLSSSPPRRSSSSSSTRSAKRAERLAPLHGIKRKVKVEMEENVRNVDGQSVKNSFFSCVSRQVGWLCCPHALLVDLPMYVPCRQMGQAYGSLLLQRLAESLTGLSPPLVERLHVSTSVLL